MLVVIGDNICTISDYCMPYEPKQHESEIYQRWQASGFFNPDNLSEKRPKKYSISIPPPNITGSLHMGHALNNTIQDIMIRFYRMLGYRTLWLPGTDHAGIATQNVVEKELAKEGLTRQKLGREKFLERVWQWKEKYGHLILEQLKKLGCSCDWSRTRFTMDEGYTKAVQTAFIHYYQKGYLYRGPRIVNWCPRCSTAISDIEVKYQEEKGKLWYIRYPLKSEILNLKSIIVATTRPETMLGDTAVAVNPNDERYKNLIGQKVILPIMNREIPIIAHHLVDPTFGTGVVKITPAHDAVDWKIGKEYKLEIINVIGPDAKMTEEADKYAGLPVLEARKKIVEELKSLGLLEKEEDYLHQISLCDRCGTPIEPQISIQWFVKMEKLAKPAAEVVKKNKIKIIPERYKKVYLDWLENIEDWCISRQLWWGHRLPVWHCKCQTGKNSQFAIRNSKLKYQEQQNNLIVSINKPKEKCPNCNSEYEQVPDVLDTWFSSALWPFATLGWPEKTKDLKMYYPTDLLSTARDILYLWVARMVFSSLEFLKKIPFKEVYIHPTVLNLEGRRMSKSLGTGIDPMDLIEKYGADATRFGIILQTNRDQQALKFDERSIVAARNFVNKLWNINRFIEMNWEAQNSKSQISNFKPQTLFDKWILTRLNFIIDSVTKKIKNYELGEAAKELYEFVWHEFADWYLEIAKFQIKNEELKENTLSILYYSLITIIKLLHPFIPFVTEQIWQSNLNQKESELLMIAQWPKVNKKLIDKRTEKEFEKIKNLVIKIRNWKAQQKIPLNQIVDYQLEEKIDKENVDLIEFLTKTQLKF
jgi:valyl-tRNA synthetase